MPPARPRPARRALGREHVAHVDLAPAGEGEPGLDAQRRGAERALVALEHGEQGDVGEQGREQLVVDHAVAEDALAAAASAA